MKNPKLLIPILLGATTLFLIAVVAFQVLEMFDVIKTK